MEFTELTCEEFAELLASAAPVPGGGGASALVAAIGVALGDMTGSLTLGKKKYADVQECVAGLKVKAEKLRKDLLECVQKDAVAFEPLSKAYAMPKDTPEQAAQRERVMADALRACCEAPLDVMRKCCEAIDLNREFAEKGAAIAVSDAGCGVICCKAALQAASLNVFANTKIMKDKNLAERYNALARDMLDEYTARADDVFTNVTARFF